MHIFQTWRSVRALTVAALGLPVLASSWTGQPWAHGAWQDGALLIVAEDYAFTPALLTVTAATTVTWTNRDIELHTVTGGEGLFDERVEPNETVSITFGEPGVFLYACTLHDWMIGEITVVSGDQPRPDQQGQSTPTPSEAGDTPPPVPPTRPTTLLTPLVVAPPEPAPPPDSGPPVAIDTPLPAATGASPVARNFCRAADLQLSRSLALPYEEIVWRAVGLSPGSRVSVRLIDFLAPTGAAVTTLGSGLVSGFCETSATFQARPGTYTFVLAGTSVRGEPVELMADLTVVASSRTPVAPLAPTPVPQVLAATPTAPSSPTPIPPPVVGGGGMAAGGGVTQVKMLDLPPAWRFEPVSLTIPVGASVRWINDGAVVHTATSDEGLWDSGFLGPGASFMFTFQQPGTYPYFCIPHRSEGMRGTITVTAR